MYVSIKSLINRVNNIDREIRIINQRLEDIDFNFAEVERNPIFASYSRSLLHEQSSLWEQKNILIDQKNNLLDMINSRKDEEEMIANLIAEWVPEVYELIHTNVGGIHIAITIKHPIERKETHMDENEKTLRKQQIDSRVKILEKINDDWIAKHGESNDGIMTLINDLMDERETLG